MVYVERQKKGLLRVANFVNNEFMKPANDPSSDPQGELFRSEQTQILDATHALVKLAHVANRERFDAVFGETYCRVAIVRERALA